LTGKLFAFEGVDGSGKATQHALLYKRLKKEGRNVFAVSYPRYGSESSALARMYLSGQFGERPEDVGAYASSTFFAADRYASYKTEYESLYHCGAIILADRYTTSNMIHQAAKISPGPERQKFLDWLWDLEFRIYAIPVPTQVFFLDLDAQMALKLLAGRSGEMDIHEKSESHLASSYACALEVCEKYGWEKIPCTKGGLLLGAEEISEGIYSRLAEYL
jgi:dTMP kinase